MADDDKLRSALNRAAHANDLLGNELLAEAYDKIESDLVTAWVNSEPRDSDGRERVWNAVQANRKHKRFLQNIIDDGKIAQVELDRLIQNERKRA